jgi:hypothetical protein
LVAFLAAFLAGAFFVAFFAVAMTISLIKLTKAPRGWMPHEDSLPFGLPHGPFRPRLATPVR